MEFLPTTYSMGPSVCNYYNYSKADLDYIKTNWKDIAGNETEVQDLQVGTTSLGFVSGAKEAVNIHHIYQTKAELTQCPQWEYDTSEFKDTAVTENDWVCDKVNWNY